MNRAKTSDFAKPSHVRSWADAVAFAAWDHPLNLFITINIDDAFVTGRPQEFLYRFLHRASDWLRYHGVGAYYAWVLENNEVVGIHCHILMHWPRHLQTGLDARLRKWLRLSGGEYRNGLLQWSDTNGDEGVGVRFSNSAVARYLLKGAEPLFCRHWNLDHKPQGRISGKRLGVSRSIDVSARSQTWEGRLEFPLAVPWSKTQQIPHFILGFYRSRHRDPLCDERPNSGCSDGVRPAVAIVRISVAADVPSTCIRLGDLRITQLKLNRRNVRCWLRFASG